MSDLRVALVAEGPTDALIVEAALKALLPRPFVLNVLQPEPTPGPLGAGWGGVLLWCRQFASGGFSQVESDPKLHGFDIFILHVDADVAGHNYSQISAHVVELASTLGWPSLPTNPDCPPPHHAADTIRACILSWAGITMLGPKTVLCVPSKSIEAWLAAALFDSGHKVLSNLECNLHLEAGLKSLPQNERIKKSKRVYRFHQAQITDNWSVVRGRCTQAERFSCDLSAVPLP